MTFLDCDTRVLVIDDDEIARELLAEILESTGNTVYQLPSAIGASRMITREAIDVVVLDVMMPSINGDKLARLLRQNHRGVTLTIILVSSRPLAELQELADAAGADAVVAKRDLRTELTKAVRLARNRRSSMTSRL